MKIQQQQAVLEPTAAPSFEAYGGSAPENYERYFVPAIGKPLAQDLVELAHLRHGERVLDVACGTGVVARLAAARVGAGGRVAGLDLNPGMLGVARAAGDRSIEWYEASAEAMPLSDGGYDAVLCQLGLQFFSDRSAGLAEMHRVLGPGRRTVLNLPGPMPQVFEALAHALAHHVGHTAAAFVEQVFALQEPDEVERLLRQAGFAQVVVRSRAKRLRLPSPREFLWQYTHSTPLAGPVGELDPEGRSALEREVVDAWADVVEGGALMVDLHVVAATAIRP